MRSLSQAADYLKQNSNREDKCLRHEIRTVFLTIKRHPGDTVISGMPMEALNNSGFRRKRLEFMGFFLRKQP